MKRGSLYIAVIIALLIAAAPLTAFAKWDVHISIPLPGLFYYYAPPVTYAPAYPAYVEPAPVFYGGAWYRVSGSRWFISAYVGGPWYVIGAERVPQAVIGVPAGRHEHHEYAAPREDRHHGGRHDSGWQSSGPGFQPYQPRYLEDRRGRHDD